MAQLKKNDVPARKIVTPLPAIQTTGEIHRRGVGGRVEGAGGETGRGGRAGVAAAFCRSSSHATCASSCATRSASSLGESESTSPPVQVVTPWPQRRHAPR